MQTGRSIKTTLAEQLDKLPVPAGSSFHKETTWKRLYSRLHNKKRKQRKALYAIGISIPVAASLFYFLFFFRNEKQHIKNTEPVTAYKTNSINAPEKKIITSTTPTTPVPVHKSTIVQQTVMDKNKEGIKTEDRNETAMIDPIIIPAADTSSSQSLIATIPVAKKKLKVVHNNELQGSTPAPEIERNAVATVNPSRFFPGFRKPDLSNFDELIDDTIKKQKPKRSLLPFSSLISQKE